LDAYPELSARVVAESLDRAVAAAAAVGPVAVDAAEIMAAARDLLDLARGRAATAHRRVGRELPVAGAGVPVVCPHCQGPIAPGSFGYGSPARGLLFASCLRCRGETTLLAATWRRLSGLATHGLATP
jgi:hypothetical protein